MQSRSAVVTHEKGQVIRSWKNSGAQTEKPRHSRRKLLSDPPTAKTSVA
jgi:hypothetical protein